jgi:hypothetical protein
MDRQKDRHKYFTATTNPLVIKSKEEREQKGFGKVLNGKVLFIPQKYSKNHTKTVLRENFMQKSRVSSIRLTNS